MTRTHILVDNIAVSPFGGSQSGRSACGRKHAVGYTLEQAVAQTCRGTVTSLVSCARCLVKVEGQVRRETVERRADEIREAALARGDETKRAHVVDDDGQVTVSGRAYFAARAARGYAADVAAALAELDAARTLDAYTTALRKLATAAHACNERAIRGLEYITLDGKGAV